jgi:hypothetical protein
MDVERIIDDIEQLQEMFEAPDILPLSASDISAANRRHDEMLAHSPWFRLWQHFGVCCRPEIESKACANCDHLYWFGAASPTLRKNDGSSQSLLRGQLLAPSPSMIFAATNSAEINHNDDNQNQQINASYRLPGVRHPRIH